MKKEIENSIEYHLSNYDTYRLASTQPDVYDAYRALHSRRKEIEDELAQQCVAIRRFIGSNKLRSKTVDRPEGDSLYWALCLRAHEAGEPIPSLEEHEEKILREHEERVANIVGHKTPNGGVSSSKKQQLDEILALIRRPENGS